MSSYVCLVPVKFGISAMDTSCGMLDITLFIMHVHLLFRKYLWDRDLIYFVAFYSWTLLSQITG